MEKRLLRQELQSNLIRFTEYFFKARNEKFLVSDHHRQIAEVLEKVERGEILNLVINLPPRYGKTELAVINWIAKCLAKNPKAKFIHLSYSDDLALDNSSKARDLIRSDEYQALWPITLKDDADSKKKWYTSQGGGLYATAAGGAITGFGAGSTEDPDDGLFYGAIIIDDPLKVDDAESEGERETVNERLNSTIKSRRNSRKTPIIIIMQRLHEEDMSGFVLAGKMGEDFHHLKLKALKDDGTALWPYKHTADELKKMKASTPFIFSGQYQQEPSPEDGTYFKREWFKRFHLGTQPQSLTKYGCSDYAVTKDGGDFTEHGVGGFDHQEDLWLIDWWSGQETPDIWIASEQKLAEDHDPVVWVGESGVIQKSVEPFMVKEQRGKKYYRREWLSSTKDKSARARGFQAIASQGKVHIPYGEWGDSLLFQLLQFPAGKYDDKVDVCSLFGRLLDQTYGPGENKPEEPNKRDPYDNEEQESDWKTA